MNNENSKEMTGKAVSQRIAGYLRERIKNGDLPPGSVLPSLSEFSQRFTVNVNHVRDAMDLLRRERLIKSRLGLRSLVSSEPKWKRAIMLLSHTFCICIKGMVRKVIQLFSIKAKRKRNIKKR